MTRKRSKRRHYAPEADSTKPEWTRCEGTGKRRYESKRDARIAARQQELKGVDQYLCTRCNGYHNGHLPKLVKDGDVVRWDLQPRVDGDA